MTEAPQVQKIFDLVTLADTLRGLDQHKHLVGIIDGWVQRNSRASDLTQARQLLGHIARLRVPGVLDRSLEPHPDLPGDLEGALFSTAILTYARAVGDGERGRPFRFNLGPMLSPEQLATHEELIKLRKTAVAHFDAPGRQNWHKDAAMVVERSDGSWEYGFSYSRMIFDAALYQRFVLLLDDLLPKLRCALALENDGVHEAISQAGRATPEVLLGLTTTAFDATKFFGQGVGADLFASALAVPGSSAAQNVKFPRS